MDVGLGFVICVGLAFFALAFIYAPVLFTTNWIRKGMGKLFFSIICLGVHLLCVYTMYKQSFDWVHNILMVAAAISFLYVNDFFSEISGRKSSDYDDDDDLDFLPKKSIQTSTMASNSSNTYSQKPVQKVNECQQKVAKFFEIVNYVFSLPYMRTNGDFHKGSLFIWVNDDGKTSIRFWYDFDCSVRKEIEERFFLEKEFYFQDEGWIKFDSDSITGFYEWCYSTITNRVSASPVIATMQANCPRIAIRNRREYETSIRLEFSYN